MIDITCREKQTMAWLVSVFLWGVMVFTTWTLFILSFVILTLFDGHPGWIWGVLLGALGFLATSIGLTSSIRYDG